MIELWETYCAWYNMLVAWAECLLNSTAAKRCARGTLAEMFVLALNAVETLDGPYMHSTDVLYRRVCMHRTDDMNGLVNWAYKTMPQPDDQMLSAIARLYAAVFETGYAAHLTLHERTEIGALIRLYEPCEMSWTELMETLTANCPTTHPLCRVVDATRLGGHLNEHVQALSLELETGEAQRGTTWRKRQSIENGTIT